MTEAAAAAALNASAASPASSGAPISPRSSVQLPGILQRITFRQVTPADIPTCLEIETASYDEKAAASKSSLQYRQHHAEQYFRCAVLEAEEDDNHHDDEVVVGFICATRRFAAVTAANATHAAITAAEKHETTGPLLAIHSVVVSEPYRRLGIATAMMNDYWTTMTTTGICMEDGVQRLVLLSKAELLVFFVKQCAYSVTKALDMTWTDNSSSSSSNRRGTNKTTNNSINSQEQWFQLERIKDTTLGKKKQGPKCWIVDSFTDTAGKGNPAAVVLLDKAPEAQTNDDNDTSATTWFQTVAREFNLSETAFVWKINCNDTLDTTAGASVLLAAGESNGNGATRTRIDPTSTSTNDTTTTTTTANGEDAATTTDNSNTYRIRYFSANGTEVDLCGHATLATAAVLFQEQSTESSSSSSESLTFLANKDELTMAPAGKAASSSSSSSSSGNTMHSKSMPMLIGMNFPQKMVTELLDDDYSAVVDMLERAFPLMAKDSFESSILYIGLDQDGNDVLVEVTPECLQRLGYDGIRYDQLDWPDYQRGVILCSTAESIDDSAPKDSGIDFWSRFFGPKAGIPEDPVTGSAHCTLAPYFGQKLNKTVLQAEQLSLRGGKVECTLRQSTSNERRVTLMGSAVIAMSGTLWI